MLIPYLVFLACSGALLCGSQARNIPSLQPRQFPDPQQKFYNGTGQNTSDPVSLRILTQVGERNRTGELSVCKLNGSLLIELSPFAVWLDVRGHQRVFYEANSRSALTALKHSGDGGLYGELLVNRAFQGKSSVPSRQPVLITE